MKHTDESWVDTYVFFVNLPRVVHVIQNFTHLNWLVILLFDLGIFGWWGVTLDFCSTCSFLIVELWIDVIPQSTLQIMNIDLLLQLKHFQTHRTCRLVFVKMELVPLLSAHHHVDVVWLIQLNETISEVLIFKAYVLAVKINVSFYSWFHIWTSSKTVVTRSFVSSIKANLIMSLFTSVLTSRFLGVLRIVLDEQWSSEKLGHPRESIVIIDWNTVSSTYLLLIKHVLHIRCSLQLLFHVSVGLSFDLHWILHLFC